jgi:hypothetical protein
MPHPTLTWVASNLRTVAIAGASSTVAELLTGIKAAIDGDSTLWETSAYSAGAYLEIKRKVSTSPTGEQATARILFFGGATPNAAACTPSVSLSTSILYACMSVDANTTGPTTAFTAGAPYSTKFIPGNVVCAGTALAVGESPRVSLVESVEGLCVYLGDINTMTTVTFGKMIEDAASGTLMWVMLPMCSATSNVVNPAAMGGTTSNSAIPALFTSNSLPRGTMWNNTLASARSVGRVFDLGAGAGSGSPILGAAGAPATLIPIPLCESTTAVSSTQSFIGYLRQFRYGPMAQHLQTLRNGAGVVQAIHVGPPVGLTGYGAWFDQVA